MNQSPYNDPTQPNQRPYANPYNGPVYAQPPQQKPPRRSLRDIRQWYRSKSTNAQAGIGCLMIIGVLLVCGACVGTMNAAISALPSDATPTATTSANVAVANNASSPTEAPTHKPASTPTPKPTPKPAPTHKPASTPTPKPTGVNGNPWGYNFTPGNYIYNPPAAFCDYFSCIASFWNGSGYVMECQDGMYSKSGGRSGSCSHHGGNWRALYSH